MVRVTFYNLLRSRHNLKELKVEATTMRELVSAIQKRYPQVTSEELNQAVLFINQKKVMHLRRFDERLRDGDKVVFTNFVGGG